MTKIRHFPFKLLAIGLPFSIIAFTLWLSKTVDWAAYPQMNLAITLDLLLTVPLVYFLLSYRAKLPKFTAISFLVLGLILANVFLPDDQQQWLDWAELALVPIEISVLTFLLLKVRKIILRFRAQNKQQKDFLELLHKVCKDTFGDNIYANLITYEISFFYYGLFRWKSPNLSQLPSFTYHKKSGIGSMYIAFLLLFFAEAATVHLLIMKYSVFWANIATGLTSYTIFQLLAHLKAIYARPIQIENNTLIIRHGLAGDAKIPIQQIKSIEASRKTPKSREMLKKLAGDLQPHNLVLELHERAALTGIYGIKKDFKTLCFYVDEEKQFIAEIKAIM
ncbi:MAG: hypothetical protein AAF849_12400 [Bacteroidota bacterium]